MDSPADLEAWWSSGDEFVVLALATATAVSLWLSALNVLYRDVQFVTPFLVQMGMFVSPVIYPISDIALRTVGLDKMYRIGGERQEYGTQRDTLARAARRPLERLSSPHPNKGLITGRDA